MNTEPEIRKLLIDACHSSVAAEQKILVGLGSPEFVDHLVNIALDADDYQGDAPMTAAFYLSKAPVHFIKPHETSLISLLTTADGYAGSVALVLGTIKSAAAKPLITRMAAEGYPFAEALARYEA